MPGPMKNGVLQKGHKRPRHGEVPGKERHPRPGQDHCRGRSEEEMVRLRPQVVAHKEGRCQDGKGSAGREQVFAAEKHPEKRWPKGEGKKTGVCKGSIDLKPRSGEKPEKKGRARIDPPKGNWRTIRRGDARGEKFSSMRKLPY